MPEYDYLREPLQRYCDKTADGIPCPGGGSVVALTAALSAALASMVMNFTIGKKKYRENEAEMRELLRENERARARLMGFVERDSAVYGRIRSARDDPGEMAAALKESAGLHVEIARSAVDLLKKNETLLEKGNRNLVSDVGISSALAVAAYRGARINVLINLKYLDDADFAEECREFFRRTGEDVSSTGEKIHKEVRGILK